jgi:hypothetical protein
MKYEVCDNCKHCTGRSHELTGDGVKHMCVCALDGCSMSMWDECERWEHTTRFNKEETR